MKRFDPSHFLELLREEELIQRSMIEFDDSESDSEWKDLRNRSENNKNKRNNSKTGGQAKKFKSNFDDQRENEMIHK